MFSNRQVVSAAVRCSPLAHGRGSSVMAILLVAEQPLDSGEQERLRRAEQHAIEMEGVLDDLPAPVWEVTADTFELNRCNAAAEALAGNRRLGESFLTNAVATVGHERVELALERVKKGETVRGLWLPLLGNGGSIVSVLMTPCRGADGKVVAVAILGEGPGGSTQRKSPDLWPLEALVHGLEAAVGRVTDWRLEDPRKRREVLMSAKKVFADKLEKAPKGKGAEPMSGFAELILSQDGDQEFIKYFFEDMKVGSCSAREAADTAAAIMEAITLPEPPAPKGKPAGMKSKGGVMRQKEDRVLKEAESFVVQHAQEEAFAGEVAKILARASSSLQHPEEGSVTGALVNMLKTMNNQGKLADDAAKARWAEEDAGRRHHYDQTTYAALEAQGAALGVSAAPIAALDAAADAAAAAAAMEEESPRGKLLDVADLNERRSLMNGANGRPGGCNGKCDAVGKLGVRVRHLEETVMQHALDKGERESRIRELEEALMQSQATTRDDLAEAMNATGQRPVAGSSPWDPAFLVHERDLRGLLLGEWRIYAKQGTEPSFSYGLQVHSYNEESMTFEAASVDGVSFTVRGGQAVRVGREGHLDLSYCEVWASGLREEVRAHLHADGHFEGHSKPGFEMRGRREDTMLDREESSARIFYERDEDRRDALFVPFSGAQMGGD